MTVHKVTPQQAFDLLAAGEAVLIDVRELLRAAVFE